MSLKRGILRVRSQKGQNSELLAKFNAGLKELKSSGKYDEIIATYIASSESTSDEASEMVKVEPKKTSIESQVTLHSHLSSFKMKTMNMSESMLIS